VTAAPARCLVCNVEAAGRFRAGGVELRRCPSCALTWRSEFPDSAELAALYGDDYFERWGIDAPERLAEVRAMKESTYRAFFEEIAVYRADGKLLDLGCALGFLLGVARARGDRVHAGPLDDGAVPGECFDVVTLIDVLEHVPDPATLLGAVAARLSPGGVAVAVLPDTSSAVARLLGRRWPHYNPEHLYYWSAASLQRFLEGKGWRVLALRRGLRKTFTARYLDHYARALGHRLVPGLGALGRLRLRIPTGEMLVIATPPERTS
jgi:SAM-dependent methyltransferase